ncbi:peptide-methionine (S)-S-oxide reductase MsrA [Rufibacter immobilis]|uniref:peptide-methionine (S)-S-oxide reductase MsrA n=1 Tax=Rufibacter immobilis TaxID=1348778 RepID=UPI0035EDA048
MQPTEPEYSIHSTETSAVHPQLVTLAMGCFWKPDALFGGQEGLLQTAVGYAGGDSDAPTYWNLGQHLETVQLVTDPVTISFEQLLDLFFSNHNPGKLPWKRQYTSAIFCHSEDQEAAARQRIAAEEQKRHQPLHTLVLPFQHFYFAEARHQKWYLQRHHALRQELELTHPNLPQFYQTTTAARLNAYLAGFWPREKLEQVLPNLPLTAEAIQLLLSSTPAKAQIYCS